MIPSTDTPSPLALLEQEARYVLAAPLVEGRRVLDLGAYSARALAVLAEAGAAEITAVGAHPETLAADLTARGVEGVELLADTPLPLAFEDAAFDLIICHDLTARLTENGDWLAELRRILHPEGYLLLAVARPEGRRLSELLGTDVAAPMTYEQAFERLSTQFGTLTLFAQAPLVGNLFYDLEANEEDPGLAFDRSLLDEEAGEVGWYLMLFGPQAQHRDDLNIVELPFAEIAPHLRSREAAPLLVGVDPAQHAELRDQLDRTLFELSAAQVALLKRGEATPATPDTTSVALIAQLERERTESKRLAVEAQDATSIARGETERVFNELHAAHEEIAQLHERLRLQRSELDAGQALVVQSRTAAEESEQALAALRAEFDENREAFGQVGHQRDTLQAELEQARTMCADLEQERGALQAELEQTRSAHAGLQQEREAQRAELEQTRATHGEIEQEREALRAELEQTRAAYTKLGQGHEALQAELEQSRAAYAELEQTRAVLQSEVERLRAELSAASDARRQLEEEHARGKQETIQTDEEHRARIMELETQLARNAEEAERLLRERSEALEAERRQSQAASEAAQAQVAEALAQVENRAAKIEAQLSGRIAQLEASLEQTRADASEARAALEARQGELTSSQAEHEATQTRLVDLEVLAAQREARAGELEAALDAMRLTHEQERAAWDDERQGQQRATAVASELQDQYDAVSRELADARRELAELRADSEALQASAASFERDRQALAQQLAQVTKERDEIRALRDAPLSSIEGQVSTEALFTSAPAAGQVTRDAVGRKIEATLEDIEDLLASAVPTVPPER